MRKVTYSGGDATKKTSKKTLNKVKPVKAIGGYDDKRRKFQEQNNQGTPEWNHDYSRYDPNGIMPVQQDVADLKNGKLGDFGKNLVTTPNGVSNIDGWNGNQTGNYKYKKLVYEHQDAKGNVLSTKDYGYNYEQAVADNSNGKWWDDQPNKDNTNPALLNPSKDAIPPQPNPEKDPAQHQLLSTQPQESQPKELNPQQKLYKYLGTPQPSVPSDDYNQFDPKWRSENFMHPDEMPTQYEAKTGQNKPVAQAKEKHIALKLASNDMIASAISLAAGAIPDQIKRDNQNREQITYNPNSYGDGTQAIAESGIHIKPQNKGKFTAYKKRTGKTTAEALHSKDPHVRKMANFARNAKKWHHGEDGLELDPEDLSAESGTLLLGEGGIKPYGANAHSHAMNVSEGPSHADGGMDTLINGKPVKIQGGEGVQKYQDGAVAVFGGMKMPNLGPETKGIAGRTFQSIAKEIAEQEAKNTKTLAIPASDTDGLDPSNKFDSLELGSKIAKGVAFNMRSAALTAQKNHLRNIQEAMHSIADERGKDYSEAHKLFGKKGLTIAAKGATEKKTPVKPSMKFRIEGDPDNPTEMPWPSKKQIVKNPYEDLDPRGASYNTAGNAAIATGVVPDMPKPEEGQWRANMNDAKAQKNIDDRNYKPFVPTYPKHSLADENKLRASDFLSELSYLGKRPDQVVSQEYKPYLETPYQVSFQDRRNQNQATFNELSKQLQTTGSAASLAALAGQKYEADNAVNAEEFRTNQGIFNAITNQNYNTLNDANKFNTQLKDQQYVRQSQAKSNTDAQRAQALASISSKIGQNRYENMNIRMTEQRSGYRWNPDTKRMEWEGGPWQFNPYGTGMAQGGPSGWTETQKYNKETGQWEDDSRTKKATVKFGNVFKK